MIEGILFVATVLSILLLGYWSHYQMKVIAWCDAREKAMVPLIQAVHALHVTGAPQHSLSEVDGIFQPSLVEVNVSPDSVPEGENWVVAGDHVYVKRSEFIPSKTGVEQFNLLREMEGSRRTLISETRKGYQKLVLWEKEHPIPQPIWAKAVAKVRG